MQVLFYLFKFIMYYFIRDVIVTQNDNVVSWKKIYASII
jgi:hypothetical protein